MKLIETVFDEGQRLLHAYRWYLLVLAFCALAAYGFTAFNLTLAGDDWLFFVNGETRATWVVRLGRWMQRLVVPRDAPFAPAVTLAAFVISVIIAGWVQSHVIGLERPSSVFFFVALLLFHPFWSEEVSFKLSHIGVGIAILLASLSAYGLHRANRALLLEGQRIRGTALLVFSALLLALAIATKQNYLFFTFGAVVFGVIVDALKGSDFATVKYGIYRVALAGLVVGLGLVFYTLSVDWSQRIFDVPPLPPSSPYALTGSLISSADELTFTLQRFADMFVTYHFRAHYLMPFYTKVVYLVALVAFVVYTIRTRRVAKASLVLLGLAGLILMPWVLVILRVPAGSYRYTALVANAGIYAAVIAIVIDQTQHRAARLLLSLLATTVLVVFLHQHSSAALITYTNNQRDMAIANRMLMILEQHPNYPRLASQERVQLIVVGTLDYSQQRPFAHVDYATNYLNDNIIQCDVFNCQTQRLALVFHLLQAGDLNFGLQAQRYEGFNPDRQARLAPIIDEMTVYPASGSIHITDERQVLIKLSEP